MARHFFQLRLAGYRNRVRAAITDRNRRGMFVLSALVFGYLAVQYGPTVLDFLHRTGSLAGGELLLPTQSFSLVFAWVLLPIAGFGGSGFRIDDFRLLPLRPRQLADGILLGSVLSAAVAATALYLGIIVSGYSVPASSLAVMVLGGVALLAMCLLGGRLASTGVDTLARNRRSRDLLVIVSLPVSLVPLLMVFEIQRMYTDPAAGSPVAGFIQWIPFAWPGRAMAAAAQDQIGAALGWLAACAVLLGLGRLLLVALVRASLYGEDRSHAPIHGAAHPFGQFATRLPANRTGAVAAETIRSIVRDSSRIPQYLVGTLVFGGLFVALGVAAIHQVAPQLAVLGTVGLAIVPGRRYNEIGDVGPAYWMNVVAPGSPRRDLLGRDAAALLVDGPLCLFVVAGVGIGTRGWSWLPVAVVFVAAALAVSYSVVHLTSTALASGPDIAKDDKARTATGRNPKAMAASYVTFAGIVVGIAPMIAAIYVLVQYGTDWAVPLTAGIVVYGVGIYVVGLTGVSRWLQTNEPTVLARVGG